MALCPTCHTPIPCHCHIPPARQITPGVYTSQPGPGRAYRTIADLPPATRARILKETR